MSILFNIKVHIPLIRKVYWQLLFLWFQLAEPAVLQGRQLPGTDFPNLQYNLITEKDGLPSPITVNRLVKDKRGFMWTCGQSGLYRYDGFRFKKFLVKGSAAEQQEFDKYFYMIVAIGDSTFWSSSLEGIMRVNYYTGSYQQYPAKGLFTNSTMYESLVKLNDQQALIAIKDSLLLLGINRIEKRIAFRSDKTVGEIWRMYNDNAGRIWADAYLNQRLARINDAMNGYDTVFTITDATSFLFTDNNKKIWMPTWGAGVQVSDMGGGNIRTISSYQKKIFMRAARYVHPSKKEFIITGFDIGFLLIDVQTLQSRYYEVPSRNGLRETKVMYSDDDGSVWMMCSAGLFYLSSKQGALQNFYFRSMVSLPSNFYDDAIYTGYYLSETRNRFFVGLYFDGGSIVMNKAEQFEKYIPYVGTTANLDSRAINFIAEDKAQRCWVVTDRKLALCDSNLRLKKWFDRPVPDTGYKDVIFRHIHLLNDTMLLIRGYSSFHLFNTNKGKFVLNRIQPIHPPPNYRGNRSSIRSAWLQDNDAAKIWYATDEGVYRYNLYTDEVEEKVDSIGFVGRISGDRNGNVWIAALQGLLMLDTKQMKLQRFSHLPGAQTMQATGICTDSSGRVWFSSQQGIQGYNPVTKEFSLLTIANGALENSPIDIMSCTSEGKIYYGYQGGFALFNPGNYFGRKQKAFINELLLNDTSLLWKLNEEGDKTIELPFGSGVLSIGFASVNYYPENSIGYYYRIHSADKEWHLLDKGQLSLVNLSPGKYHIEVGHSAYPATGETDFIIVRILPPFYKTVWFTGTCILLLAGILFYLVRSRIRRMKQRAAFEKDRLENETLLAQYRQKISDAELALLHSQMSPHFIFNCLNSIKLYIEKNDIEAASGYLTKFSKLIRTILDNSRSENVTLASELDSLKLYLELEAMRFKNKLQYHIEVDDDVDETFVEVPPLLIQPYAENAIWHGLMHKEEGGRLNIHVSRTEGFLAITIEDNGVSRKMAAVYKSKSVLKNKSHGMVLSSDRIALINKYFKQQASVEIKDLLNDENLATGTLVIIKIPV